MTEDLRVERINMSVGEVMMQQARNGRRKSGEGLLLWLDRDDLYHPGIEELWTEPCATEV